MEDFDEDNIGIEDFLHKLYLKASPAAKLDATFWMGYIAGILPPLPKLSRQRQARRFCEACHARLISPVMVCHVCHTKAPVSGWVDTGIIRDACPSQ